MQERCNECVQDLEINDPEENQDFCCEYSARSKIQAYCDRNFVPLTVTRTEKENLEIKRCHRLN